MRTVSHEKHCLKCRFQRKPWLNCTQGQTRRWLLSWDDDSACQISAAKQLFRGRVGWAEERLKHTFEASLGVITVSLSSCVIGDAHFRAPASNSRSYPLLTFKCALLAIAGKRKCVICAEEGHNAFRFTVWIRVRADDEKRQQLKRMFSLLMAYAENNGFFPLKRQIKRTHKCPLFPTCLAY